MARLRRRAMRLRRWTLREVRPGGVIDIIVGPWNERGGNYLTIEQMREVWETDELRRLFETPCLCALPWDDRGACRQRDSGHMTFHRPGERAWAFWKFTMRRDPPSDQARALGRLGLIGRLERRALEIKRQQHKELLGRLPGASDD